MKLEGDKGLAFSLFYILAVVLFGFPIFWGEAPSAMAAEGATKQAV